MIEILPIADLSEHERKERLVGESVRSFVLDRDQQQCQGCGNAGENRLQLHHIVYRSHGGLDEEENLVTLCGDCHRDVHAGYLRLAFIEWQPGYFSWFCARKRLPRRWFQKFNKT